MNWILKIAPKELKLIDVYLRESYSWIWATRIHFTLYAMLLLGSFAALIGFITPVDIKNPMSSREIMTFFSIFMFPAIIFMGYMIFQLCLFSVEKRKGKSSFFRPLLVFPLMMISVLSPLVMPFSVSFVLNSKIANLAPKEQVNSDELDLDKAKYFVNTGEQDYKYFATNSDYIYWEKDNTEAYNRYNRNDKYEVEKKAIYFHEGQYRNERPRLYKAMTYSNYYNNSFGYSSGGSFEGNVRNDVNQFYYDQNLNLSLKEASNYLEHLNACLERYSDYGMLDLDSMMLELKNNTYINCYSNNRINRANNSFNYNEKPQKYYNKVSGNLRNIKSAQIMYVPKVSGFIFLGFLWAAFIITLLLFIFRLVHWKQFLLSILIIGIYLTLIGIVEGVGDFDGYFFPIMAILFVVVSMIFLNRVWALNKFSVVINQMAIVTFLSLAFFPIMILGYLEEVLDIFKIPYFDKYLVLDPEKHRPYSSEYYEMITSLWVITFWSGILFFYLLGLPYLKKVFLRLMSLPKKS